VNAPWGGLNNNEAWCAEWIRDRGMPTGLTNAEAKIWAFGYWLENGGQAGGFGAPGAIPESLIGYLGETDMASAVGTLKNALGSNSALCEFLTGQQDVSTIPEEWFIEVAKRIVGTTDTPKGYRDVQTYLNVMEKIRTDLFPMIEARFGPQYKLNRTPVAKKTMADGTIGFTGDGFGYEIRDGGLLVVKFYRDIFDKDMYRPTGFDTYRLPEISATFIAPDGLPYFERDGKASGYLTAEVINKFTQLQRLSLIGGLEKDPNEPVDEIVRTMEFVYQDPRVMAPGEASEVPLWAEGNIYITSEGVHSGALFKQKRVYKDLGGNIADVVSRIGNDLRDTTTGEVAQYYAPRTPERDASYAPAPVHSYPVMLNEAPDGLFSEIIQQPLPLTGENWRDGVLISTFNIELGFGDDPIIRETAPNGYIQKSYNKITTYYANGDPSMPVLKVRERCDLATGSAITRSVEVAPGKEIATNNYFFRGRGSIHLGTAEQSESLVGVESVTATDLQVDASGNKIGALRINEGGLPETVFSLTQYRRDPQGNIIPVNTIVVFNHLGQLVETREPIKGTSEQVITKFTYKDNTIIESSSGIASVDSSGVPILGIEVKPLSSSTFKGYLQNPVTGYYEPVVVETESIYDRFGVLTGTREHTKRFNHL
ncbi:MAG TPA: hypothetical protein PLV52_05400, partial [Candidatus Omnitrophota bacterium]|nr:hypothetical protein [Candidatus Omnitrophota bacterium]